MRRLLQLIDFFTYVDGEKLNTNIIYSIFGSHVDQFQL